MASLFESYELTAALFDRVEGSLYEARDRNTNVLVLLQRPPAGLTRDEARQRLLRESGVLNQLAGVPGVAQVAQHVQGPLGGALVLKFFPGISLAERLKSGRPDVGRFLDWALALTGIVDRVHQAGFLHRDLHPASFLLEESSGEFLLTGFGLASPVAEDRRSDLGPEVSDWSCLAPEQTGRINAPLDRRTDYYALGMVFYTLLAGKPAFAVTNALEAVHAHLARVPVPPADCPPGLAEVVLKLLAKDPGQRYQSLTGLTADLNRCRDQWRQTRSIAAFPLGSEDLADQLRPTRKLFGRHQELEVLRDAYAKVVRGGRETLLLSGPSGVGKTALAAEAGTWAQADQGFFLQGKYDETRQDHPYSAIVELVEDLVRQLARRPDRDRWTRTFTEALGDNQAVVTSLVPSFETLTGPLEPPPPLPPRETENRFLYTFASFLGALQNSDHPVVLHLDDIQWIDPASVRLLDYLGMQRESSRLLTLYSFRTQETQPSAEFPGFLARLEAASGHPIVTLGPLAPGSVADLVAEVLGPSVREPESLARSLFTKTAGSPFFLAQMIRRIHREGILFYDRKARRWDWNQAALQGLPASDSVSSFLIGQFESLPPEAAALLSVAACLGATIEASDLTPFADLVPDLAAALFPLVERQYLVPLSDGYLALASPDYRSGKLKAPPFSFRFQHDRIRQAARDRLSPEATADIHHKAALWLETTRPAEAAGHFLAVLDRIQTPERRRDLALLLIRVAESARASSAVRQALDLLRQARQLAEVAGFTGPEDQRLLLLLAETAYLCHEVDEGETVSQLLLGRLSDPEARAGVYQMQMDAFTFLGRMDAALERGQKALSQLGVKLSLQPNPLVLGAALLRVTGKAEKQTPEALFLRTGQAPQRVGTLLRVLAKFLVPAQMSGNVNLFVLSTLMTAELALDHPNGDETSGAFGNFAILLSVLGRHRQAYDYAGLALRLEEVRPNPKTAAGVHSAYAFFSLPWNRPWTEVPPACRRGAAAALRAGDLFYIAYQNLFATVFSPLPVLEDSIAALEDTLRTIAGTRQDDAMVGGTFALRRWQVLAGTREDPADFSDSGFDEVAAVQSWEAKKNLSGLAVYRLYKTQVLFHLDRFEEAWSHWEAGKASSSSIQGSAYMEEYAVFTVLVCAERARSRRNLSETRTPIRREVKHLAAWAATCPENFGALAALVQAEESAVRGRNRKAAQQFGTALELAQGHPGLHVRWKALVQERAALFHLRSGNAVLGRYLMGDALRLYGLWGARAKVRVIAQTYPGLVPDSRDGLTAAPRSLDGDAASLWKVAQAISRETDVDRLMPVVIQAVIENAGARQGWLLLRGERGWKVVARGNSDGEAQAFADDVSPGSEGIPAVLLAAAEGTDQGLVVSSATEDPRFSADPLVTARKLKSILALRFSPPGSQLKALWYFENDLVEGAFSADRLGGLRLLSGQVGISLENARYYRTLTNLNRDLEGKVRDRTAELEERNRQFLHSVEYAGVLQRSLLPREWGASVAGIFTLWQPRDIVGGDLYWFRESPQGCLLALVDCTGHGVPGALITVLVSSILDEAWGLSAPGDLVGILSKVNQQFRRALGQDKPGSESNDGFDIGLLWWPPSGDLRYAGSRISLIQGTESGVRWYHGSRKGLGYPETPEPNVETLEVPRIPGARYYLSSDGYLGQIGGEKGLSFGRERFTSLLVETRALPLEQQASALKSALEQYRGPRPQIDDVTVIGWELK